MVCLIMSSPIFSQTDINTEELVCIPTSQAKQVVIELTKYDLCQIERDTLLSQIEDLNSILNQDSILLSQYKNTTDSLVLINKDCIETATTLNLDLVSKEDKITRLRNTRNLTILTTLLTAILPAVINKD
jgi:hypothetical protein